jgi:hypothetical protein
MTKMKSTNNINKNKNVNKNNINITINPQRKRKYKKRSTTTQPRQQQPITIINQIPYAQQQEQQQDLKKMAYNYNIPRHKILEDNDPRPPQLKQSFKISSTKSGDVNTPSKRVKADATYKASIPIVPIEENTETSYNRFTVDDYATPNRFESQTPLSNINFSGSGYNTEDGDDYLNLSTLKPSQQLNDNNLSSFYNVNFSENSTVEPVKNINEEILNTSKPETFKSQVPTTNYFDEEDEDETKNERLEKKQALMKLKYNADKKIVARNRQKIENEKSMSNSFDKLKSNRKNRKEAAKFQTPDRRKTILPAYKNNEESINETPNMYEKPKRIRRTKKEMEEARQKPQLDLRRQEAGIYNLQEIADEDHRITQNMARRKNEIYNYAVSRRIVKSKKPVEKL